MKLLLTNMAIVDNIINNEICKCQENASAQENNKFLAIIYITVFAGIVFVPF